ncbi:MAG: energy-coupling factor transporter transmembrane component T [Thermostichales cyanobacterium BF4_bins_65]
MRPGQFLGLLTLMGVGASLGHWQGIALWLGVSLSLYGRSGLPWTALWLRWRYPLGLLLVLGLLLPFQPGETILWQWGSLRLTGEGVLSLVRVGGRFGGLVTLGGLLLGSQPLGQTLAMLRHWGIPALLLDLLGLAYRYVFVLHVDWQQMQRALWLRGGKLDIPTLIPLLGSLVVRSVERSERVYQGMRLRGYGQPWVGDPQIWQRQDWLWLGGLGGLSVGLGILDSFLG